MIPKILFSNEVYDDLILHFPSEKNRPPTDQVKLAYQVAISLSNSPHIKTGQGNPVGEKGSQK